MINRFAWILAPRVLFVAGTLVLFAFALGYLLHPA
jgi:hypothetical protein